MIRLEQSKEMEIAERNKLEEEIRFKQEEVSRIQIEVEQKDEETRRLQEEVEDARQWVFFLVKIIIRGYPHGTNFWFVSAKPKRSPLLRKKLKSDSYFYF